MTNEVERLADAFLCGLAWMRSNPETSPREWREAANQWAAPSGIASTTAELSESGTEDAAQTSEQDEREAFEAWFGELREDATWVEELAAETAWRAWQARSRVQTQGERKP
jgi:hypothetical protein